MKKGLILLLVFIFLGSCKNEPKIKNESTIIAMKGYEYYYINFNELGEGVAKKGNAKTINDASLQKGIIDSVHFKADSIHQYFNELKKFENKPFEGAKMFDSYHVLIYSNKSKVYDSYRFDSDFWKLIKTIGEDIPTNYNPFIYNPNN
jgi:hypothetical protein